MMIRVLYFFLLFSLWTVPLEAQFAVGFHAGSSILYPGFVKAGFTTEKAIATNLYLRTGTDFTVRSNRSLVRKLEVNPDISSASSSYWTLPVQLKGQLDFNRLQLYGLLGFEAGVGHKVYYVYTKEQTIYNGRASFKEFDLQVFDFGLLTGIGLQSKVGKGRIIFIDYQFYLGLRDIDRTRESTIFNESQGIVLGLLIPIQKSKNN
jgi:hypothetical protein